MNRTSIEWTHIFGPGNGFTWNPITGCSANCFDMNGEPYCYARRLAEGRLRHVYPDGFVPTFWPGRLEEPVKRKKPAGIFLGSMGDIWDPRVPQEWRDQVWDVVRRCPQHVFFVLTKQPQNVVVAEFLGDFDYPPTNLDIGVSIESEETLWRAETLLDTFWAYDVSLFISFEPLLGPVCPDLHGIDWIIIGQDSRRGQPRPEAQWVADIVGEGRASEIPVFIKPPLQDWWPETIQEWPDVGQRSGKSTQWRLMPQEDSDETPSRAN